MTTAKEDKLTGLRVLVVDDDHAVCELIKAVPNNIGVFHVVPETNTISHWRLHMYSKTLIR